MYNKQVIIDSLRNLSKPAKINNSNSFNFNNGGVTGVPQNYDPEAAKGNTDFLLSMVNSPLFVERYARMVGKPIEEVAEEAEAYKQQMIQNLQTVGMGDSSNPPESYESLNAAAYYKPPYDMEEYNSKMSDIQRMLELVPNRGKYNKELKGKYQSLLDDYKSQADELNSVGHKLYFKDWDKPNDLHERSHASTKGRAGIKGAYDYKYRDMSKPRSNSFSDNLEHTVWSSHYPKEDSQSGGEGYHTLLTELKARKDVAAKKLQELGLYDPVNENFTEEHYKKLIDLMKNPDLDDNTRMQIRDIVTPFTKEDTIKMFNDIVQNEPNSNKQFAKEGGAKDDEFISPQNGVDTPIYKAVKVAPSKIEGKGLFADQGIKKGDVIGVSHIRKKFMRDGEEYQAPFPSTVLGYYNHSTQPNVHEVDKGDHILMVAHKDIQPGDEIVADYTKHNIDDLEVPEDFKKGGSTRKPKIPKGKSYGSYSRSFEATNRLFAQNPLFAKPKSRKNKIFDPNAKYYAKGGVTEVDPNLECDDEGRCYETDQIQKILDEGSYIPKKNVNIMWDVVDANQGYRTDYDGDFNQDPRNARNIWTKKGAQALSKRMGMYGPNITNAGNCMWSAGMGYQCLPETKGKIPLMPFESNDKFINAVNKGTVPFSRVTKTHDPNFASQETGMLQQGDIVNFKGGHNSHAMTFSHYREDGMPIFLNSNGSESNFDWDIMWPQLAPNKEKVAYVSRFNPEKFYEKDIKTLEEKARTNPTMIKDEDNGISLKLSEDEIKQYVDGGYVVEDISVPSLTKASLGKILKSGTKESKTLKAPTLKDVQFRPAEIQSFNPQTKQFEIHTIELPDRIVPGRDYADVKHKMANLRKDLQISSIDHALRKYVPGAAFPIGMAKDSGIVIDPTTGQLFDSNTRYWLNREYGFEPNIGELLEPMSSRIARDYGQFKMASDTPFENKKMGINYMDELANPYTQKGNGLKDLFNQPVGGPLMIGMGMMGKPEFTKEIKNPDYFTQLLGTFDSKKLSSTNKKYYKDLINSVKNQNGLATDRQFNELQRLKTGNFDFGSKGYNKGYADGGETEYELGEVVDELTKKKLEELGYTFEIVK